MQLQRVHVPSLKRHVGDKIDLCIYESKGLMQSSGINVSVRVTQIF